MRVFDIRKGEEEGQEDLEFVVGDLRKLADVQGATQGECLRRRGWGGRAGSGGVRICGRLAVEHLLMWVLCAASCSLLTQAARLSSTWPPPRPRLPTPTTTRSCTRCALTKTSSAGGALLDTGEACLPACLQPPQRASPSCAMAAAQGPWGCCCSHGSRRPPRAPPPQVNVEGTANVVQACVDSGVRVLVYTSSASVVSVAQPEAGAGAGAGARLSPCRPAAGAPLPPRAGRLAPPARQVRSQLPEVTAPRGPPDLRAACAAWACAGV